MRKTQLFFISSRSPSSIARAAGISRVKEEEEPIDPSIARAVVAEPWRLLSVDSSLVLRSVKDEFGIGNKGLVSGVGRLLQSTTGSYKLPIPGGIAGLLSSASVLTPSRSGLEWVQLLEAAL